MAHYVRETDLTETKRSLFKDRLDEFCTFTWDGVDMFEEFGVFITNKRDLKFYNGPSYSNQYTAPMFSDATGDLTGLKFSTQKISFSIGVYWFSEQDYRRLIAFLSPNRVGGLIFDFEPNWSYNVKLSGRKDSTRTVIGYEGEENRYYTELNLDFEIQGDSCATYRYLYTWNKSSTYDTSNHDNWLVGASISPVIAITATSYLPDKISEDGVLSDDVTAKLQGNIDSDIPCGFKTSLLFNLAGQIFDDSLEEMDNPLLTVTMKAVYTQDDVTASTELFNVSLSNLIFLIPDDDTSSEIYFNLTYNSTDGLLFWDFGGEEQKLLTKLSMIASGERIVQSMKVNQFKMPGILETPTFNYKNMHLEVDFSGEMVEAIKQEYRSEGFFKTDSSISMFAKTNLI